MIFVSEGVCVGADCWWPRWHVKSSFLSIRKLLWLFVHFTFLLNFTLILLFPLLPLLLFKSVLPLWEGIFLPILLSVSLLLCWRDSLECFCPGADCSDRKKWVCQFLQRPVLRCSCLGGSNGFWRFSDSFWLHPLFALLVAKIKAFCCGSGMVYFVTLHAFVSCCICWLLVLFWCALLE